MRVAIIGGKLQGVEAAYLARKAGWQTVLIDRAGEPPAAGLCHEFFCSDICTDAAVQDLLTGVDLIIPALENHAALAALKELEKAVDCPVAFDFSANSLSSLKSRSHDLFAELGLDMPLPYPYCGFPMLVKPDSSSGSKGVTILADEGECETFFGIKGLAEGWVGQQFVSGPSYSLEVIGRDGSYITPQVTELHMDQWFDCKAVTAPARISAGLSDKLRRISLKIAEALDLNGIMDVEVIAQDDRLYLLEIDARLPSQTPIAVYWSSGINMLEKLADAYLAGTCSLSENPPEEACVRLEHISVDSGVLTLAGEHLMAGSGPVHIEKRFFGVREAITDFRPGKERWCATLIHTGSTLEELQARRMIVLAAIRAGCGIERVVDSTSGMNSSERAIRHDAAEIC